MKPLLRWDIFCRVIDNFGDIGVCWRLAADLAGRGHAVRLWVDDARALAWMAPVGCVGVDVRPWPGRLGPNALDGLAPADVWIEAFGCELPAEFVDQGRQAVRAGAPRPVWLNLEYLSAEPYVERNHALPSPAGPGESPSAGEVKWFFYPGFTRRTGGLLREPDLQQRQAGFDSARWLAALAPRLVHEPATPPAPASARLVSLFCYEPAPLAAVLRQWMAASTPTHLLVTSGRAAAAVRRPIATGGESLPAGNLSISYLPPLTQIHYDHLLWACDLNFVRGEDSVVRAIWAGRPFVWQIYPQDDGVHHAKLDAFLDRMAAPASLRQAHHAWNGPDPAALLPDLVESAATWASAAAALRADLLLQDDLASQLLQFVLEKR